MSSFQTRPHISAGLLALLIAGIALASGVEWSKRLEKRYVHAFAPDFGDEKLQGIALQKEALAQPDLLMLYGSSELGKEMPNNATQFFADYPTGFRVFPVGRPGSASLSVLQKVAAAGQSVRGRKVAFSISPGWFFSEVSEPTFYEGNFSPLQTFELAFSDHLSRDLKRDIARRMLAYPKTLEDQWLLGVALERLAGDSAIDEALYTAIRPLGYIQQLVGCTQDHFETALHIIEQNEKLNPVPRRGLRALNWTELLKRAAHFANQNAVRAKQGEVARRITAKASSRAKTFLRALAHAEEWTDLELLLRTFKELGAEPLLLTMPVEDIRLEVYGLAPSARTTLLDRLNHLADRFDFPLLDFRDHQDDRTFTVDFQDHLSGEGWLYYNKALDDFFHGRITSL